MEPRRTMSRRSTSGATSRTSASWRRIATACSASEIMARCISLLHGTQHFAAGMVLGIAHNLHPPSALPHHVAFGHALRAVIGALGLNVGANFADQGAHVGLREDHH